MKTPSPDQEYVTTKQIVALRKELTRIANGSDEPIAFQTFPRAEGLLLYDADHRLRYLIPTFSKNVASVNLLHRSEFIPR